MSELYISYAHWGGATVIFSHYKCISHYKCMRIICHFKNLKENAVSSIALSEHHVFNYLSHQFAYVFMLQENGNKMTHFMK